MTLLDGKSHTAISLAEKFEISTKTVYRQVNKLVSAGYPITTLAGKNGGIMLSNRYVCNTWFFSADELSFIANLICSNSKINPQVSSIVFDKIKNHIENNNMIDASKKLNNLFIDSSQWFSSCKQNINQYSTFLDACENNLQIEIEYNNEIRTIYPYCIVLKESCYYLYAYCTSKQDFRLFKINRISNYKILKSHFERISVNLQNKPWNNNCFEKVDITISSKENIINELSTWATIKNFDKEKYVISATYNHGLINKLIEYGNKIKVISPKKIIDEISKTCKSIINLYV